MLHNQRRNEDYREGKESNDEVSIPIVEAWPNGKEDGAKKYGDRNWEMDLASKI